VTRNGEVVRDASGRAVPGTYRVEVPPPAAAIPEPQDLPLDVLFEDAHLIVVNKAAGMAVHPGPGVPDGTLVNALLHHCGASLSGIGGVARPGIVHRLDKETSGVMVAAKTDAAHQGLAALFAAHDIERSYIALVRGAPRPPAGEIRTRIGRSTHDRMKMAVLKAGGREAVTHYAPSAHQAPPWRRGWFAGLRPDAPTRSGCTWPRWAAPAWAIRSMARAHPPRRCARR
jgi:23S rRNA pseudouridine1911/1915/1917 synthase